MPKADTKFRILALEQILLAANKPLLCPDIEDKLYAEYRIEAERKTLYDDIDALKAFYNITYKHKVGYQIEKECTKNG